MNSILCVFCCATEADLNIAQTAWGDSGVYYCSVVSSQDLSGNSEAYTELIVLGKLVFMALSSSLISPSRTHTHTFCLLSLPATPLSAHNYTLELSTMEGQVKILASISQDKVSSVFL